jgi:hypothetical protein
VLEAIHETTSLDVPVIPVWLSLVFIVGVLTVTALTSVYATRNTTPAEPDRTSDLTEGDD